MPASTEIRAHRINQLVNSEGNTAYSDTREAKLLAGVNKGMTMLVGPCEAVLTADGVMLRERNPANQYVDDYTEVKTAAPRPPRGYNATAEMVAVLARDLTPMAMRPGAQPKPSSPPQP